MDFKKDWDIWAFADPEDSEKAMFRGFGSGFITEIDQLEKFAEAIADATVTANEFEVGCRVILRSIDNSQDGK